MSSFAGVYICLLALLCSTLADAFVNIFSAAAASLVSLATVEADEAPKEKMTILITGANSGIGLDAATKLSALGHDVYVACRSEAKAAEAARLSNAKGGYVCDLSSLQSIRNFVREWGEKPIDALCLNAGVAPSTKGPIQRTAEGFEMAVGTNHLGHFLLAESLMSNLESSKLSDPRLVVTASSVHDPSTPGGDVGSKASLGNLAGLVACADGYGSFDMVDGGDYDGDKAYKDSKLCNVLFTIEMERRLRSNNSKVHANCFSPGLIPNSGLFRNQNPIFSKIFSFVALNLLRVACTVSDGGDCLVFMVTDQSLRGKGGLFLATEPGKPRSQFGPQMTSVESQDEEKARKLWELSRKCVNV